ncbi:MAG TPA: hypothetical protein PKW21_02620 [Rhabdaerophilum sp.]|nr:hypothetical protein [Rhabdaerophilum sp.]
MRKVSGIRASIPLGLDRLYHATETDPRRVWTRLIDRETLRERLSRVLRETGHPIAFEIFGEKLVLGDDDVAIVIGEAEWDTVFVAQRERGALSNISIHASGERAVCDFLARALSDPGECERIAGRIVRRHPLHGPAH